MSPHAGKFDIYHITVRSRPFQDHVPNSTKIDNRRYYVHLNNMGNQLTVSILYTEDGVVIGTSPNWTMTSADIDRMGLDVHKWYVVRSRIFGGRCADKYGLMYMDNRWERVQLRFAMGIYTTWNDTVCITRMCCTLDSARRTLNTMIKTTGALPNTTFYIMERTAGKTSCLTSWFLRKRLREHGNYRWKSKYKVSYDVSSKKMKMADAEGREFREVHLLQTHIVDW
jgi:hypothetical protein